MWLGFAGLHNIDSFDVTLNATMPINRLNWKRDIFVFGTLTKNVKMDFVFVIVLAVPLRAFSSQLNFCQYSHTALGGTVACNSSPADLAAF